MLARNTVVHPNCRTFRNERTRTYRGGVAQARIANPQVAPHGVTLTSRRIVLHAAPAGSTGTYRCDRRAKQFLVTSGILRKNNRRLVQLASSICAGLRTHVQWRKRSKMADYTSKHARAGINAKLTAPGYVAQSISGISNRDAVIPNTRRCAQNRLPDYGTITIEYEPKKACLELKALKCTSWPIATSVFSTKMP